MKRNVIETVFGGVVLFIAAFFLVFSYNTANVKPVSGYDVYAEFSGIGGLRPGDDVQISGVKIGSVSSVKLNADNYLAKVIMTIDPSVKLPDDTTALISSQSLLGGRYLSLEPGGSDDMLPAGGRIQFTQAPQNLEQLLGQFIFSMAKSDKKDDGETSAPAAAPLADEPATP